MSKLTATYPRTSLFLILFLTLALLWGWRSFSPALAQSEAQDLAGMAVELWPDYDEPSMLVLLTGIVPPDTPLPATVTIPFPETAELNAVARVTLDDRLVDDIEFEITGNSLTLVTPNPQFHVEYYDPYVADGLDRSYVFEWLATLNVDQMSVAVQQPLMATGITINPEPVNSSASRSDGLTYHTLASRVVPAGELFSVSVDYAMSSPQLSAPALSTGGGQGAVNPDLAQPAASSDAGSLLGDINPLWIVGIFGVAALVGLAFVFGRQQSGSRANSTRKPKPKRPAPAPPAPPPQQPVAKPAPPPAGAARFCHNCGQPATPDDRFCSSCGTRLKGTA